jgi:hypothetical protein
MQIVVNHVTRMQSQSRICIAGVDLETGKHVRPITPKNDLITRALLRSEGGPFGPGAFVDLGDVTPAPQIPEVEDHWFQTANAQRLHDVTDADYLDTLDLVRAPDVGAAFGGALREIRQGKFAVPAGQGGCSLAVVEVCRPSLKMRFDNLYLDLRYPDTAARLRVTDVRFYEPDHMTVRVDVVGDVQRRLRAGTRVYAMLGLAREMYDEGAGGEVHWLQVNGVVPRRSARRRHPLAPRATRAARPLSMSFSRH